MGRKKIFIECKQKKSTKIQTMLYTRSDGVSTHIIILKKKFKQTTHNIKNCHLKFNIKYKFAGTIQTCHMSSSI